MQAQRLITLCRRTSKKLKKKLHRGFFLLQLFARDTAQGFAKKKRGRFLF
jgi:hypothetical protein